MILRFHVVLLCSVHILAFGQLLHVDIRRLLIRVMKIQFLVLPVPSWLPSYVLAGRSWYLMFVVRLKRTRCLVGWFVESAFGVLCCLWFLFLIRYSFFFWNRLMGCGFHHCERLCHNDECGNCSAPCGKTRKSWYVVVTSQQTKKVVLKKTLK